MSTGIDYGNGLGRCWCDGDETTGGHSHPRPQPPQRRGWECPKCGAVYAPWVMECKKHRDNNRGPFGSWRGNGE